MGVKVKDYIAEINRQKQEAIQHGKTHLIIKAGELHAACGDKKTPSLIQCCSAMRQCMLMGDEILFNKENKTGASTALMIKYDLQNMENRGPALPLKKRGRPAGIKNTPKESDPLKSMTTDEHEINLHVENWMRKEHIRYESCEDVYLIHDAYGLWMIAKYREETADKRFLNTLRLIKETTHKCTLALKDTKSNRDFWNGMSEEVLFRLNFTVLFVTKNGTVTHLI